VFGGIGRWDLFNSSLGDRFTKVIVNRKSKITLKISLRARIRAFHQTSPNRKSYDLRLATSNISYNGGKKIHCMIYND
jgi:hypothetical protein